MMSIHYKNHETSLESEPKYRSIFENQHIVMLLLDPADARIVDANPAACAFYGYRREKLKTLKMNDISIVSLEDASRLFEKMKTYKDFRFIFQQRLASGEIRYVEVYVGPFQLDDRTINYAIVVDVTEKVHIKEALQTANDQLEQRVSERTTKLRRENERLKRQIAKQKRTDEASKKSRDLLQTIFDGITEPLIMLGADMSIKILNNAALNYYGVTDSASVVDKCCFMALRGETEPCKGCEIPSIVLSGEAKILERKVLTNPERTEQVSIYPAMMAEGKRDGAIVHIKEITEAKLMQRQLTQSEKLASIGLLTSGIAHEINNPSNFITLNIPVMREYMDAIMPIVNDYAKNHPDFELFGMSYPEFNKDVYRLLENIAYGSSRITSIVTDLREFARMGDTKKQMWVDLKSVIEKGISICKSQIQKKIKYLDINIPEGLPRVFTNPRAVEQVLINLLVNAAQAADKKDSWIKLDVLMDKIKHSHVIIKVEDNGCGMDEKTKTRLFDPFFTTKSPDEGTGLGLYVSLNLIEALGGRIELDSEPGKGSTFRVILPNVDRT